MNQERTDAAARGRTRDHRRSTADGRLVDAAGEIVPGTSGWAQHPQSSRATRRLQPVAPPEVDARRDPYADGEWRHPAHPQQQAPNVTVSVNGSHYRPWREELLISGWRSAGNLLAWPFRLVAGLIGSALRIALTFIIGPAMLLGAIAFYQSHKDASGPQMAHDVGKAGVGLVGAAIGGIWDGIFGSDEPDPAPVAERPSRKEEGRR